MNEKQTQLKNPGQMEKSVSSEECLSRVLNENNIQDAQILNKTATVRFVNHCSSIITIFLKKHPYKNYLSLAAASNLSNILTHKTSFF